MNNLDSNAGVYEGLQKDPSTGDYRVEPGYSYQALRYRIHESWLDEEDNLWIGSAAVEREARKKQDEEPRG